MPCGDSSGTGGNSRGGRESGGKLRAGGNRARNRAAKAESWLNQERETKKRGGRTHGGGLDLRRGGDGDPSSPAHLREGLCGPAYLRASARPVRPDAAPPPLRLHVPPPPSRARARSCAGRRKPTDPSSPRPRAPLPPCASSAHLRPPLLDCNGQVIHLQSPLPPCASSTHLRPPLLDCNGQVIHLRSPVFPSLPSALVLVCPFPSSLYCLRLLPCSALCLYCLLEWCVAMLFHLKSTHLLVAL